MEQSNRNPGILGLPSVDLMPDLTRKRPYLDETENCYFKKHQRGELPDIFISERP